MSDAIHARDLVSGVLHDLGLDVDDWQVVDVVPAEDAVAPPRTGLMSATHLLITVAGPEDHSAFQAYFTEGIERTQADVATAEQVQDHVIELLGGVAAPPCPGHVHPLHTRVLNGRPMWVCPHDPDHHRAPITGAR